MDELEQIGIVLEDGFVDIDLPLAAFGRDEAGVQEVVASGLHQGGRVGFKVRLEASWERQELEGGAIEELYWGRAEISSIGAESDRFLELLDQLYGKNISARKMRDRVPFLAVSLSGNPICLEQSPVKMKLFFESEVEERDADFYLNIDNQARLVEFHEKDTDYRRGVVLSLCADPV